MIFLIISLVITFIVVILPFDYSFILDFLRITINQEVQSRELKMFIVIVLVLITYSFVSLERSKVEKVRSELRFFHSTDEIYYYNAKIFAKYKKVLFMTFINTLFAALVWALFYAFPLANYMIGNIDFTLFFFKWFSIIVYGALYLFIFIATFISPFIYLGRYIKVRRGQVAYESDYCEKCHGYKSDIIRDVVIDRKTDIKDGLTEVMLQKHEDAFGGTTTTTVEIHEHTCLCCAATSHTKKTSSRAEWKYFKK